MTYKIERNVPIPMVRTRIPQRSKYPFSTMYPSESFLVKVANKDRKTAAKRLRSRASYYLRTTGRAYTVRQVEDGVRVWRKW